jgi:hypothetical protein
MGPAAMMRIALTRATAALLIAVALAACSSKVTEENYEKIVPGMKEEEVRKILGLPSESRSTAVKLDEVYTSTQTKWTGDQGTIVVLFFNGEVQSKMHYPPGVKPETPRRD